MSDDLVKRWDEYVESMGCVMGEVEHMAQLMRDRIEELEAEIAKLKSSKRYWLGEYDVVLAGRADANDRIEELEAKLAKAVGLLEAWVDVATHCTIEEGVCCCGDNMDTHAKPMDCGHSPVDHGAYIANGLVEETNATLAELTGGKDE